MAPLRHLRAKLLSDRESAANPPPIGGHHLGRFLGHSRHGDGWLRQPTWSEWPRADV